MTATGVFTLRSTIAWPVHTVGAINTGTILVPHRLSGATLEPLNDCGFTTTLDIRGLYREHPRGVEAPAPLSVVRIIELGVYPCMSPTSLALL